MATKNTSGGGARTNVNGLLFEDFTALHHLLPLISGGTYNIQNMQLFINGVLQNNFMYLPKGRFRPFLRQMHPMLDAQITNGSIWSKELRPDQVMIIGNTINILEAKTQNGAGSVDEKLQTCDFKKKQFERLFTGLYRVEYVYLLDDWFLDNKYRDVKWYITASGCRYFFAKQPYDQRQFIDFINLQLQYANNFQSMVF